MMDGTGRPQSVVVLGGGSDIAGAALRLWARGPLQTVVLGVKDVGAPPPIAAELATAGCTVEVVEFDALGDAGTAGAVAEALGRAGEVDVALIAFGVLGDQAEIEADPDAAADLLAVNAGATVVAALTAAKVMKEQGHGVIVIMSSVAGQRARRDNFVYGSSKAAADVAARGLSAALEGTGVHVVTVRPGFVRSKMTTGRQEAPFAVDADRAGRAIVDAVARRRPVVWVPPVLGLLFFVFKLLPEVLWRRLARRRTGG